ncbi:MAG: dethiobiotin synthase [Deltaproteobacteria bacterium]|nr:dethiobiotin synthase [Deltaproteobacteria bacterium]MBW1718188.1 dethiobiotin synthase [Deltaproteobacteria bacterium]MBW2350289.1 dethiobiotin synthase [Deltaproteobacteria bacterium]
MILFVTGTDTGVGKTFITALLAKAMADQGIDVKVQKWVSTGNSNLSEDCVFIYELLGNKSDETIHGFQGTTGSDTAPYCLSFPASPHLASEKAGVTIKTKVIRDALFRLESSCEILIVEGVGGVLVPLTRAMLLVDLVADLKLPTLVVARSGLGTLNHTLLTLEALRYRKIPIVGVLLNSQGGEASSIVRDNQRTIAEIGQVEVFGVLPRVKSPLNALSSITPMADRILSVLKDLEHFLGTDYLDEIEK